ncbi:ADP-ribosylglycohydrolase family protein [Tengunoibacter tsumagoiensis]|uniref:ADP-ribosylglycohydrolase n=1 Tax=Tengunoibacter tsumagoiensis TaxID=2014871 RepID=A0A402A7K3_9CHLR|nr:ADP-ribosylglycohydrolase family protein [Tengunoibacter tsumagoiensis]GCE15140.1 hypothetical protein KTT_49990 [Tengunoibacter tsumagoiensis]
MAGWDILENLVRQEVIQRREEGCGTEGFIQQIEQAAGQEQRLMEIYMALQALPIQTDFPFAEPNDLEAIRAERPEPVDLSPRDLSEEDWYDKFLGAWLGRCAGCALGKPLETGLFMHGGWTYVKRWFEGADAWPITGYTPAQSRAQAEDGLEITNSSIKSTREHIRFMETDDDIRYTVLGLLLLEERGSNFDAWDIGKLWHRTLPYEYVATAEAQSYLNFSQVTSHAQRNEVPSNWNIQTQDWVRTYLNPYREWIGAQIRVDGWAYGAAGRPELAAELAWRDASFSHVKNGIYGAMFMAAMISAAFIEDDMERIIAIGLSKIPRNCRLAHDIRRACEIAHAAQSQEELVESIWQAFKHYGHVHTNNNAALVVAALLFAQDDYQTAITTAVLGGWDTDCNGATVGSIMGAKLGARAIPEHWTAPLHDMLYAEIHGFDPISISTCAKRSYKVFQRLRGQQL